MYLFFFSMSVSNILQFLSLCGKLKRTVRTGWTRFDIKQPESVADHMYRMALMSFVIPADDRQDVSVERVMKMAVVHDLAESLVGDITPYCNVTKEEKYTREATAMNQLCDLVPKESADEIQALWNEYEAQETMEARFCKDFDKFEMLLQAFEYEKENNQPKQLEDFFSNTLDCFVTPTVKN
ncbi:unnamed protein product [Calicophoron daubneyi]|uniref:5'-deoxynucleotidase HDDC2 n=1 Tax=Calicophoron daubneyi TaxID=300641 RepID=A0AAV2TTK3_CALDB